MSWITKDFDKSVMKWLQEENLQEHIANELLETSNTYLLKYVVIPIIKLFYYPAKLGRSYEIRFIPRNKWQLFQDKNLERLLSGKHMTLVSNVSKSLIRGYLKLLPKTNCDSLDFRPIISPSKKGLLTKEQFRKLSAQIHKLSRHISPIANLSLYKSWKNYTNNNSDTIYGIKLDIKDAFGSINVEIICQLIQKSALPPNDKSFIISHILNQYVYFNKLIYKWNRGILQGDHLSSSICNLYLSFLERESVQMFSTPKTLLVRKFDDYFFCSPNFNDLINFEYEIKKVLEVNKSKTEIAGIDGNRCVNYFGYIFNLSTKDVQKLYMYQRDTFFHHRFKIWNISKPVEETSKHLIVLKGMKFSCNNHCFTKILLNTIFNTEEKVLRNYYDGMLYVAFKFHVLVMSIRHYQEEVNQIHNLSSIVENTIRSVCHMAHKRIMLNRGSHFTGKITCDLLCYIGHRAFSVIFKKYYAFYQPLADPLENTFERHRKLLNPFNLHVTEFKKVGCQFRYINTSRKSLI